MIKTTETLILKESFEYCPYIREMQKEQRRKARIQDADERMDREIGEDIPETSRLKAHLKRRVERTGKNKWIRYATEYASEIMLAGPQEKEKMRRYLEMTKEAVMAMDEKDRIQRTAERNRRVRTRDKHSF